ncbi:MAG: T9SS type A sorting domain-containing protein [Ignavibacteriaceae bacterium]|jgi:pimeloyl-ACP methyl ester carboxylesterase
MKSAIKVIFLFFLYIALNYGQAKFSYPIIFVHGLNDNAMSWDETISFLGGSQKICDVCLNDDSNNSTANINSDIALIGWRDDVHNLPSPTGLYAINFDSHLIIGHETHELSNEAAIYKQGKALSQIIDLVLHLENATKVILVGHSMGGLAIREYLQRKENGMMKWWVDPNDPVKGHRVAKVVTIGTPHGGSDAPAILAAIKGVNMFSEAVRDLRYTLNSEPNIPGVYLYGGDEKSVHDLYYNYDVNCNGFDDSSVHGISEIYEDLTGIYYLIPSSTQPLPQDIKYIWIVSKSTLTGDWVVSADRQWLYDLDKKAVPAGLADTLMTNRIHTNETSDYYSIIRGLDEPDSPSLAYKIGTKSKTKGYITYQENYYDLDVDLYKIIVANNGYLTMNIEGDNSSGVGQIALLDSTGVGDPLIFNGTNVFPSVISFITQPGTYYIRVRGLATNNSWQHPYSLSVEFTELGIPLAPVLLTPPNGSMNIAQNTTLNWESVLDASIFNLQVSTNQNFSNLIVDASNVVSPSYYLTNLGLNTMYYWRVNSKNTMGTSNWSEVFTFTTAGASRTLVNGTIKQNTTWTFSNSPYEVTGDISIDEGYVLTVEPGVIIRFRQNTDIYVRGGLNCSGFSDNPIVFTSASLQIPGFWGGVKFYSTAISTSCILNYCKFYYGASGGYDNSFAVIFDLRVNPTITNTTIEKCKNNALGLTSGGYSTDVNIKSYDLALWLDNDLTMNAGATLTIAPGNIFKMANNRDIYIKGGLVANGEANKPIIFTSYRDDIKGIDDNGDGTSLPQPGDWGGIQFQSTAISSNCILNNCKLYYGATGGYDNSFAVIFDLRVNPTITNTSIENCKNNALGLMGGGYSTDVNIKSYDLALWLDNDLTMNAGATLTISSGNIFKMASNRDIYIKGGLVANGELNKPIIFTSYRDDIKGIDSNGDGTSSPVAGDWGGIQFQSTAISSNCLLNNCKFSYGASTAYGVTPYAVIFDLRVNPTIVNTTIENCKNNALGLMGGGYSTDVNIKSYDLALWLDNDLTMNAGATLTISPGNIFKMAAYRNIYIKGGLVANGESNKSIIFTSYRDDIKGIDSNGDGTSLPQPGDWAGIQFQSTAISTNCILNYCKFYYGASGGYGDNSFAVIFDLRVNPTITNTSIENCKNNALGLIGGGYSTDVNIKSYDLALWLDNDLTMNAGATLTISPGNIFKMAAYRNIYIKGGLVVNGESNKSIIFTSYKDDARDGDSNGDGPSLPGSGNWGHIQFFDTAIDSSCKINYCNLYYSGNNVIYIDGASPLIQNSIIDSSSSHGIYINNQANPDLGGGSSGSIGKNILEGFADVPNKYAVYNNSTNNIAAKNNYWGTSTSSSISNALFDYYDNSSKGIVNYVPFYPTRELPVELINFQVIASNQSVDLMWQTATEVNNNGFEVERNSTASWSKIGFVEGNGTTTTPKKYSFHDENLPDGKYSYRLKQIDFDGRFEYSHSVVVEISDAPKVFALSQNYPNPFNPSTKIKFSIPQTSFVTLKVYDMLGKEIITLINEEKTIGNYEIDFNASNLSSGVYFYKIQASSFIDTKKFILLR